VNEQSCKSGWVKVLLDTTKILTAFLLAFTLMFVLPAVSAVSLYVRSGEFASVSGVILQKGLSYRSSGGGSSRRDSGGNSKSKYCGFNYEYTVNNIKYNGNRLTLHSDDNKYHYFLWSIPFCPGYDSVGDKGETVHVLYNPAHPKESLIIRKLPFRRILNGALVITGWISLLIYFLKARSKLMGINSSISPS
jgi:Protein of unknown function (DUF3592)